jgi:hypothetical protein
VTVRRNASSCVIAAPVAKTDRLAPSAGKGWFKSSLVDHGKNGLMIRFTDSDRVLAAASRFARFFNRAALQPDQAC